MASYALKGLRDQMPASKCCMFYNQHAILREEHSVAIAKSLLSTVCGHWWEQISCFIADCMLSLRMHCLSSGNAKLLRTAYKQANQADMKPMPMSMSLHSCALCSP